MPCYKHIVHIPLRTVVHVCEVYNQSTCGFGVNDSDIVVQYSGLELLCVLCIVYY